MGGIGGINAFRQAANMPYGRYGVEQRPSEPRIKLIDGGPEGNRRLRQQLFQTINSTYNVSQDFLESVKNRLGLAGDLSIANTPLEEREISEIISEAETVAGVRMMQTSATVMSMTNELIDKAFANGLELTMGEVFSQIADVLPSDQLSNASRMLMPIYNECMCAHLAEVQRQLARTWQALPAAEHTAKNMAALQNEFMEYGRRGVALLKQAATKNDFNFDFEFTRRMLSMVWSVAGFAGCVGMCANIVKTRVTVSIALKEAAAAETRVAAEEGKQRIREMTDEMQRMIKELDKMLQRLAKLLDRADAEKDQVEESTSSNTVAASLDQRCQEISQKVAGFKLRFLEARLDKTDDLPKNTFDFNAKGL